MKVIKILLEFEGWDPNGSKKTLKKSVQIFTLKPHSQPGLKIEKLSRDKVLVINYMMGVE